MTDETPSEGDATVAGIKITHPGREVFPRAGLTKLEVARYYEKAGPRMIEIGGHRPLSLVRCPEGIDGDCFYQKHGRRGFATALERIEIEERAGSVDDYLYATRTEGLISAVQMGTLEFHIWGARVDRLERPDRLIFDLDPGKGVGWEATRDMAAEVRGELSDLGLASAALVTGGKGVHVCVPLRRTWGWDTLKGFARAFAERLAERDPDRITAAAAMERRAGRVFIDWLRNERGSTGICPYSLRARPGAPVAVPVTWEELATLQDPAGFDAAAAADRLAEDCPYLAALSDKQTLTKDAITDVGAWEEE